MVIQIQCILIDMNTSGQIIFDCTSGESAISSACAKASPIDILPDILKFGTLSLSNDFARVMFWLVMTFKARSGTQFHGCTFHLHVLYALQRQISHLICPSAKSFVFKKRSR